MKRLGPRGSRAEVSIQLAMALREYLGAADLYEEAMAERLSLGRSDLRCFDLLERRGTMPAGALATASGLTTGAVTFLIDRLEAHGMVRRRRDTADRRRVLVEVAQAAAQEVFALHQPMIADMRALAQRYRLEELAIIRDFLDEARQVYEKHAPQLKAHMAAHAAAHEAHAAAYEAHAAADEARSAARQARAAVRQAANEVQGKAQDVKAAAREVKAAAREARVTTREAARRAARGAGPRGRS